MPAAAARTATAGFRPLRVSGIDRECVDVISLSLEPMDGWRLTTPLAGQFVVLRLRPRPNGPLLFRSYSLSGPLDERYRVSVKVEPTGATGSSRSSVQAGDSSMSASRGPSPCSGRRAGGFSAGIGATPVGHAARSGCDASPREVWWLHGAQWGHTFATEARQLRNARSRAKPHLV